MKKLNISVLYVEDQQLIQQSVIKIIENKVRKVYFASNGLEGLEKYKEKKPDLVITDIKMPRMSGLEMLKRIRNISKDVNVIIVTAYDDTDYLFQAIDLCVDKFIMKPLKERKIYPVLETMGKNILIKKKMKEEQNKFLALSSSTQDAIFMIDNKFRITFWNDASEKIFGFRKDEILGKKIYKFILEKDEEDTFKSGFSKFSKTGQGDLIGQITELIAIKKDGIRIPVELSLSSIKLEDKWHTIGILRNITKRKKSEKKLRQAYQKMDFLARMDHLTKISSRWDILEKLNMKLIYSKDIRIPFH